MSMSGKLCRPVLLRLKKFSIVEDSKKICIENLKQNYCIIYEVLAIYSIFKILKSVNENFVIFPNSKF